MGRRAEAAGLIVLAAFAIASSVIVTRLGFSAMSPLMFATVRLVLASLLFTPFLVARRACLPRTRRLWLDLAWLGAFNTALPIVTSIASLAYISSTMIALIYALMPAATGLIAYWALHSERLTRPKIAGLVVAGAGAVLLLLSGSTGIPDVAFDWRGYALGISGMLAASASAVYIRRHLANQDTWVLAGGQHLFSVPPALALVFAAEEVQQLAGVAMEGWLQVVYVALMNSGVAFVSLLVLNQRFGAVPSTLPSYLIPLMTAVLGAVVLGEIVTPAMLLGGVLIITGLAVYNRA
ncbi:MAG: DMT family transporter [Anaerolineae bacterium]|nr:DMT family transporter [Anaerolineae bacterium]